MLAQAIAVSQKARMQTKPKALSGVINECLFTDCKRQIYAQSVCRMHYMRAQRLGIPPAKLPSLAGLKPKEKFEATVSPRITQATLARLQKAVDQGRADSVYKLAGRILEDWRDVEEGSKS